MSRLEREAARILKALNLAKVRATYGAVGHILGVHPKAVGGYLGNRRHFASWIVRGDTGEPSEYLSANMHPDLKSNPRIIDDPQELLDLIEQVLS